jgi:hypothetical protein
MFIRRKNVGGVTYCDPAAQYSGVHHDTVLSDSDRATFSRQNRAEANRAIRPNCHVTTDDCIRRDSGTFVNPGLQPKMLNLHA